MSKTSLNVVHGTLDVLILKSLIFGPLHGYGVATWIRQTTDGALEIEEGALYTALHRMEKRKWLTSEWGQSENNRRAKYYALTNPGRNQLTAETRTWNRYIEAVSKVLNASAAAS